MRTSVFLFNVLLFLIALAGIGVAVAMVVHAVHVANGSPDGDIGVLAAIAAGILPFLIGTVALAGFTIVLALDHSREARHLEVAHLAALLKQHRPQPSPDAPDPGGRGQWRSGQSV